MFITVLSVSEGHASSPSPTPVAPPGLKAFTEETERDLSIKREVPLYLHQSFGNLSVQGWVQDRIRVTLKKHIIAADPAKASQEMKKFDLITLETNKSYEVRIGHTQGTDLVSKLRDEKNNQVSVDLEIKAPYQLGLTVVLEDGRSLDVQQWKGALSVSAKNANLNFSKLNLQKPMHINCANCGVSISNSSALGHILAGNKVVNLNGVEAQKGLFIDVTSGEVRLDNTQGKFSVHSTTGRLNSSGHSGMITFQSEEGGLFVNGLKGNLEAETQSGQMMVDVDELGNHLHLDTDKSDIQVSLPAKFEGELDLLSLGGEVVVQFPHQANEKKISDVYGPTSPGRVDALVGNSHEVTIHAYSKQGGVRILRKVPKK